MKSGKLTLLQIIPIVLATIGICVPVFIFLYTQHKETKQLYSYCISNQTIFDESISNINGLDLRYKGKTIRNLTVSHIRFINSGGTTITSTDIESNISILLKNIDEIISAEIVQSIPKNLTIYTTINNKAVILSESLLNPEDQFDVKIYSVSSPNKTGCISNVTGRIAGISRINYYPDLPANQKKEDILFILFIYISILLVSFSMWTIAARLKLFETYQFLSICFYSGLVIVIYCYFYYYFKFI